MTATHANAAPRVPSDISQHAARIAAVLFVTATATTMAGQILLEASPVASSADAALARDLISAAIILEFMNGLASAGIALALFPVLRRVSELAATGYLGLRVVEGTLGVTAAAFLLAIFEASDTNINQAFAYHDATFLAVLIVFSCGTLLFYPLLYKYRLVPRFLSLWGLVGGLMLLMSCLLILFGRIDSGGTTDFILSLPIWINEMALAGWLFFRGLKSDDI